MALLEELAQKEEINIDFHNHCQTGSKFRKKQNGFWNLLLSEGFKDLTEIFDRVMISNLDGLYMTNFSDSRYKNWTSKEQLELAKKAGYEIEQGEYYTFFKKDGRVKFLGESQEVPTAQGHVLFAGLKKDKRFSDRKSLEDALKEATDNELKIADHSYAKLRGQNGIMGHSKNPEEDAKKVDAFERNGNFYLPFSLANWRAMKYSRRYNKPILANADGHHPKDIGKTYNIFNSGDLNYKSEKDFRDSISNNVRAGNFDYRFKPIPPWRVFHHMVMIFVNKTHYKLYKKKLYN